ncbi:MAG: PilW family protein [Pseudomonadota bacterium]
MKPSPQRPALPQAGFTLVEVMVGLTIGMLAAVVIMQVFSVFEAQKRTTTGTADAQTSGNIALYNIGRELQLAGYTLVANGEDNVADSAIECTTLTINGVADTPNRLSPVSIADGGIAGGSDTITIRYGNSNAGGIPTLIRGVGIPPAKDVTLSTNFGCNSGDTTLIVNGATCAMASASAVAGTTSLTLTDTTNATIDSNLSCLGNWNEVTYTANNGNLERDGVPSVAGIVNLQAQYGISATANSNPVTQWVDASGGTWGAPTVADRNRIKAIRIAVVARNSKTEPENVTTAALSAWQGGPVIDLSASDPNWQRYRYRVFETILPLRNVIWAKGTL